ncbi:hypothetical protein P7K49_024479 [Saguinus oedipus]|uniref:Uncharacterized protein n=1 Tax=Saguinus oedipus TaxID=9490 RepID=A0ABQ9UPM4_SAGOE|nr:hypothetical protein P7K49_024479 [Saguinus oedipus]
MPGEQLGFNTCPPPLLYPEPLPAYLRTAPFSRLVRGGPREARREAHARCALSPVPPSREGRAQVRADKRTKPAPSAGPRSPGASDRGSRAERASVLTARIRQRQPPPGLLAGTRVPEPTRGLDSLGGVQRPALSSPDGSARRRGAT